MDNDSFKSSVARRIGSEALAGRLLDALTQVIRQQCQQTARVAIPGFGSFEGKMHDEEVVTDLASGKKMLLPPAIVVEFAPGSGLKKKLKSPKP